MQDYRIGDVAQKLDLSVDTLRYYERIGLLPDVSRTMSGIRRYDEDDLATLRFIKRAQLMNFTLSEIGALLNFRKNPNRSKKLARELAEAKLEEVNQRLRSLGELQKELGQLVGACTSEREDCAVISGIEGRNAASGLNEIRNKL